MTTSNTAIDQACFAWAIKIRNHIELWMRIFKNALSAGFEPLISLAQLVKIRCYSFFKHIFVLYRLSNWNDLRRNNRYILILRSHIELSGRLLLKYHPNSRAETVVLSRGLVFIASRYTFSKFVTAGRGDAVDRLNTPYLPAHTLA